MTSLIRSSNNRTRMLHPSRRAQLTMTPPDVASAGEGVTLRMHPLARCSLISMKRWRELPVEEMLACVKVFRVVSLFRGRCLEAALERRCLVQLGSHPGLSPRYPCFLLWTRVSTQGLPYHSPEHRQATRLEPNPPDCRLFFFQLCLWLRCSAPPSRRFRERTSDHVRITKSISRGNRSRKRFASAAPKPP